jgi:ABC-type Mn2+/Zn2+ transport system permease subunit
MLLVSTALGGLTALLGMYLSYYLDIASGASIVLFAALLFMGVLGGQRFIWRRSPQLGAAGPHGGHHM